MIQKSTLNQLGNAHNKYQGNAKRVLCICSAGMLRSATAAHILHKEFGFNTRSAGIADYALIPVSQVLLEWADQIVFMDQEHKLQLQADLSRMMSKEDIEALIVDTVTLNIPDNFEYMNEELQKLILTRYKQESGMAESTKETA